MQEEEGGERQGREEGRIQNTERLKHERTKKTNERTGKVIKIMRRQRRDWLVWCSLLELALFQRCGFSSSELRVCACVCVFWLHWLAEAFASQRQQSVPCLY